MERRSAWRVKRMIWPSSSRECSSKLTSQGPMHPGRSKISCQIEVFKTCKTPIWEEVTIGNSKLLSIRISQRRRRKMISLRGKVTTSNAWSVKNTRFMWKTISIVRIRNAQAMRRHTTWKRLRTQMEHREVVLPPRTGQSATLIRRRGKGPRSMWQSNALIAPASLLIKQM